jgi:hypothetical protein
MGDNRVEVPMPAPDILISYTHDTKPLVRELAEILDTQGFHTWVAFRDLSPGQQWQEELKRAAGSAKSFIFVVGKRGQTSPALEFEWQALLSEAWANPKKRLLPVLIDMAVSPPFLSSWVALRVNPGREGTLWTRKVIEALESNSPKTTVRLAAENRRARNKRLNELAAAAQAMKRQMAEAI